MLADHPYYLLMAGLPPLRRFDRLHRLAISRERLDARLTVLPAADAAWLRRLWDFLGRDGQFHGDDAGLIAQYDAALGAGVPVALRSIVKHRLTVATIMASLRRHAAGLPPPRRGSRWGVEPLASRILRAWDRRDFGLGATHPWVPSARELLKAGEFIRLELQQQTLFWRHLELVGREHHFDLTALLVYVCRWHITERWLRRDAAGADQRLRGLLRNALGEHESLYS